MGGGGGGGTTPVKTQNATKNKPTTHASTPIHVSEMGFYISKQGSFKLIVHSPRILARKQLFPWDKENCQFYHLIGRQCSLRPSEFFCRPSGLEI